jgi:hypothetical protein
VRNHPSGSVIAKRSPVVFIDNVLVVVHTSGIMSLKRVVFAVFVLTTPVVMDAGQVEHAPTVAQCQADQRLWMSKLQDAGKAADSSSLPAYAVIEAWTHEMRDCQRVDPDNKWTYYNTNGEIWVDEMIRMEDFMRRHQTWDAFIAEDAAGKR